MEYVTSQAPETSNSFTLPTDGSGSGSASAINNLFDATGGGSSQPPNVDDTSSPPPPDDDTSPPPPPPDDAPSTPPPEPTPPPPDSSPPPPPSSPPPPESTPSPPPQATVAAPPPPENDSPSPPVTPVAESPPSPIANPVTPSSQFSTPLPPSNVPSDTTSPSRPIQASPTDTSPSRPIQAPPTEKATPSSSSHSSHSGEGSSKQGSTPSPTSDSTDNFGLIVGLVVIFTIILAIVIIGVICCCKRKKRNQVYSLAPGGGHLHAKNQPSKKNMPAEHMIKLPRPPGSGGIPSGEYNSFGYSVGGPNVGVPLSPNIGLGVNTCSFTLQDLSAATGGFSEANVIGQGGFGYVYKGVLPNGKEVAVKSLKPGSGQGEREFQAEVEIISRVHHRYLVSLVGYCIADGQRILVYDFVPNKTLEYHLHGEGQPTMDWTTRLKIATGSAKGLAYLHEDCHPRIIHRDIKAANILIDYNFEAQVADFGLAKLSVDNNTHVSTRVMGTFGYLAPEYASSGKLSDKSDVFSFGVMLLELITGRRPIDHTGRMMEDSLVDWARPHLTKAQEDGNYEKIADPRMEGKYDQNEMARMVACASSSVRHSARRRPKMSQIVRALEGDSSFEALNDSKGNDTSAYDTGEYNADMMKFRKMVMSNQDFDSSEYGDSNEYGMNPSVSSSDDSREMPAKPRF